jgi:hypothetical protein
MAASFGVAQAFAHNHGHDAIYNEIAYDKGGAVYVRFYKVFIKRGFDACYQVPHPPEKQNDKQSYGCAHKALICFHLYYIIFEPPLILRGGFFIKCFTFSKNN